MAAAGCCSGGSRSGWLLLRREPQLLVLAAGRADVGDAAAGVLAGC